jgi:RHS repeat-associated protein
MTYQYDNVNRVLDVNANRGTTPIADYAYQRDQIGRVTTLTELSGRVVTYAYSVPGRLVNETITGEPHGINGSIGYTHDAAGNRLTRTSTVGPVTGQTFAYDANDRITTETFDLNGNTLTGFDGETFEYDFENRLVAIGTGAVGLSYDGDGAILSRMESGTKTSYLVDSSNPTGYSQVLEELVGSVVSKTFTYGRMALRSGGQSYVADGHSNVRIATDASGQAINESSYEAFGAPLGHAVETGALGYIGERTEGRLIYARARHYRTDVGAFLGSDSMAGDARRTASLHRRLYSAGEPVNRVDRNGYLFDELVALVDSVLNPSASGGVTRIETLFTPMSGVEYGGLVPLAEKNPTVIDLTRATDTAASLASNQIWSLPMVQYANSGGLEVAGRMLWLPGTGVAYSRPQTTTSNIGKTNFGALPGMAEFPGFLEVGDYHTHPLDFHYKDDNGQDVWLSPACGASTLYDVPSEKLKQAKAAPELGWRSYILCDSGRVMRQTGDDDVLVKE